MATKELYATRYSRQDDERTVRRTREEYEDCMKQGRIEEAQRVLAWHDAALLRLKAAQS